MMETLSAGEILKLRQELIGVRTAQKRCMAHVQRIDDTKI